MFCSNCGNKLEDGDLFCSNCGVSINNNSKKKVHMNKKRKSKINLKLIIIVVASIPLIFIAYKICRFFETKYYYKLGCEEFEKFMNCIEQGENYYTSDINIRRIEDYFNTCDYGGNNIDYDLVHNCYEIVFIYTDRFYNKGPLSYSLETWQSYSVDLNKFKTKNDKLNKLISIMKAQCDAAVDFYNFDFEKSYEDIMWCKDYVLAFYNELYYYSYGIYLIAEDNTINDVLNNNIKIEEIEIFLSDASDEIKYTEGYPIVICQFDDSSYDFFWNYDNGYYTKKTLTALMDYNITHWSYDTYYTINSETIEGICNHIKNGTISFLYYDFDAIINNSEYDYVTVEDAPQHQNEYFETTNNSMTPFYGIWCYGSKDESDAEKFAEDLINKGISATVFVTTEWSNLNSEKYYVVSASIYYTEEDAKSALVEVKAAGYSDAYVKYSGDYLGN